MCQGDLYSNMNGTLNKLLEQFIFPCVRLMALHSMQINMLARASAIQNELFPYFISASLSEIQREYISTITSAQ